MRGINKAIILGNLGQDPESFNGGSRFTVATNETWNDKGGVKQERTEWHNCTAFGKLGEIAQEYLSKGSKVYVEGRIQTDKYEKDGQTRYATKIIVRELQMLDSRSAESTQSGSDDLRPPTPDDFDDDIPF